MSDTVTEETTETTEDQGTVPETEAKPEETPAETPADQTTDTPAPEDKKTDDSEPVEPATMPDSLLKVGEKDKEEGEAEETLAEPYDIELPEGMPMNTEILEAMTPDLRKMEMKQETVQGLSVALGKAMAVQAEQAKQDEIKLNEAWQDQLKTSEAFGGDGEIGESHFKSSVALANKAANAFGDVGLNFAKTLVQYGINNEPNVMMFMKELGAKVGESQLVTAGETTTKPTKSREQIMYGETMNDKT